MSGMFTPVPTATATVEGKQLLVEQATVSLAGKALLATNSDMALGLNATKIVTPITMRQSQIAAKAWVNFNAKSGALSVRDSYNVSSVTDNGLGDYTVNFTSNFANTNYSQVGNCESGVSSQYLISLTAMNNTGSYHGKTTGSCRFEARAGGNGAQNDMYDANASFFGDV